MARSTVSKANSLVSLVTLIRSPASAFDSQRMQRGEIQVSHGFGHFRDRLTMEGSWIMRRCDRQKSPPLTMTPLPSSILTRSKPTPLDIILRPADQHVLDVIRMGDDVGRGLVRQRLDLANVSEALE